MFYLLEIIFTKNVPNLINLNPKEFPFVPIAWGLYYLFTLKPIIYILINQPYNLFLTVKYNIFGIIKKYIKRIINLYYKFKKNKIIIIIINLK